MSISFGKTFRTAAAGVGLLLVGQAVEAATITLDQTNVNATPGDVFTVTVIGQDFSVGTNGSTTGGTQGGGLSLSWDPSVITMANLGGLNITFPGDEAFAPASALNSGAGTLSFSVASFTGTSLVNFDIAELTFTAAAPGVSALSIAVSALDVWSDYGSFTPVDMTPSPIGGLVTVASAVPLPPAVLLLSSGVIGLLMVARGRRVCPDSAAAAGTV